MSFKRGPRADQQGGSILQHSQDKMRRIEHNSRKSIARAQALINTCVLEKARVRDVA
jgi:hypothetical protein